MLEMIGALAGLAGKGIDAVISRNNANKNIKLQREFAQKGIQWKVADAQAAGLHPLAALGAQTSSFSPVQVGSDFGSSGQDVTRAIQATQNNEQRLTADQKMAQHLALQKSGLENQLLASQIAKMNQAGQPPAAPTLRTRLLDGQGNTKIKESPMERQGTMPGDPTTEAGAVAERGLLKTQSGLAPVYSKDAKDRLEEDPIGSLTWNVRNRIMPTLGVNAQPPPRTPDMVKDGTVWIYHPLKQEYQRMKPRLGGWVHW